MLTSLQSVAVPPRLALLTDLAYNLWWSWHESAKSLFRQIDPVLWESTDQNPAVFLHRVAPERLAAVASDPDYLQRYEEVGAAFEAMRGLTNGDTWVGRHEPALATRTVAYLSAEFGLHRSLPIYSGGLGVLAGDHLKEASDLGLPLVGISLLYRQGYLRQQLTSDGWQQDVPASVKPEEEPTEQVRRIDGSPLLIEVALDHPQSPLHLAIWRVQVGRVPLYLLDADVEGNPEWTRAISSRLYGGDNEHRLRQEIILGIGGVRAVRAIGVEPAYWHANEGHAALHMLERIRELVADGLSFEAAHEQVLATTVFTSHTPVPAGHDVFPPALIDRYFAHYWPQLGLDREAFLALGRHDASGDGFNLTALSLRLAGHRNAVSQKHGEITRAMWRNIWPDVDPALVPITSITNGVHLPTWISPRIAAMLDRSLPSDWRDRQDDPEVWDGIDAIPDAEFWATHLAAQQDLLDFLRSRTRRRWASGGLDPAQVVSAGPFLKRDALTIGFARRFATYKRATLIFHDLDRLARLLNDPDRPVQLIFAGKAHPADEAGKSLIQEIYGLARDPRLAGRVAFVEDYDIGVASHLVAGVDVWLNNPRAPLEASGTSGIKAAINGVPNLSILDGWWREAWRPDNSNGWGLQPSVKGGDAQDAEEALALYDLLESTLVPLYYDRDERGLPLGWIQVAKSAIRTVAPAFSARRMLVEYIHRLYIPASGT